MYTLEQLRMLVDVVETGSFSACARKHRKAQSAVSQGIANLEIDLDLQLFDRTTRVPSLTPNGARILEMARAVLAQSAQLNIGAQAIQKGEEARVRLAVDDALMLPRLANTLDHFSTRFPATQVDLLTIASPDVPTYVAKGKVDLGLCFTPIAFGDSTDVCFIGNLPFVAVSTPDHPLADRSEIAAHDLYQHRQLMVRGFEGTAIEMLSQMAATAWSSNSFNALCHMSLDGLGWAYLPEHMTRSPISTGQLIQLPVSFDHKPWNPAVEIVTRKHKAMGPALTWLKDSLKTLL